MFHHKTSKRIWREVTLTYDGRWLATVHEDTFRWESPPLEGDVSIWDLKSFDRIARLRLPYDIGGNRVAVSPNGKFIVSGSFESGKIVCAEVGVGNRWARNRAKLQNACFLNDECVCLSYDEEGTELISVEDGGLLCAMPSIERVFASPYSIDCIAQTHDHDILFINPLRVELDRPMGRSGRELVGVAYSDRSAIIAECARYLRHLDLETGRRLFRRQLIPPWQPYFVMWMATAQRLIVYCRDGLETGIGALFELNRTTGKTVRRLWDDPEAQCEALAAGLFIEASGVIRKVTAAGVVDFAIIKEEASGQFQIDIL